MNERIDLLNREYFIENVVKVVNQLSDIRKGCCFSIEGSWGIGKTFVIENIEEKLKEIQLEKTNDDRYFVFHYNCWQHDYYEEPAVAIISAMLASINEDEDLINEDADNFVKAGYGFAKEKFKEIAGLYIENKIGINLISLADDINSKKQKAEKAEWEFDKMFNFSQTIEKVRKELQEIAKERTIVLFVDELDRCIPQYAIKVLERLHHIFYGLENIVVVLAIDRGQLEHSVEEMFGMKKDDSSIDVEKYLKKFIDFSLVLDNGTMNASYWEKYDFYFNKFIVESNYDIEEINFILPKLFKGTDIRKLEKIIEKVSMVHSLICSKEMDISLLVFEIMFEVIKSWGLEELQAIALINEGHYIGIEEKVGKEKVKILKLFADGANDITAMGNSLMGRKRMVYNNLYGRVFWYFANIFYDNQIPYMDLGGSMNRINNELEIAKKYCEFCEIVK